MTVEVLRGDCRQVIPTLGVFDLVFMDPPFGIQHNYDGYDDRPEYLDSLIPEAVEACWDACDGVMCLHGPDDLARRYIALEQPLGLCPIAWVNWHYRFGQCHRGNWIDARCHCLIYAKHSEWTWNPDEVLVDSDRKTEYADRRIDDYKNGGQRLPGTVWGVPSDGEFWGRVQGNNAERRGNHPNQLPERYLERLILAYTAPGDRVLDPFAGSGTTAVVADALGRDCVTVDISHPNSDSVVERVKVGAARIKSLPLFGA